MSDASKKPVSTFVDLVQEPAIHVRLRTGWTLGRSADGPALVLTIAGGGAHQLAADVPASEVAPARLASGTPLGVLRDLLLQEGGARHAAAWLVVLQKLCRAGGLAFPLVDETGERAVMVPQWSEFVPALASHAPPAACLLDRFACMRRDGGAWVVESPLCGARVSMPDLSALEAPVVRRALAAAGFLETGLEVDALRRRALAQWEFHDLLFHVHSRGGWHHDPSGGVFPFLGEIDPLPAKRPPWPGEPVELPRTPEAPDEPTRRSFASVLERRRSERHYDEAYPVTRQELGFLLDRAARIRSSGVFPVGPTQERTVAFEITQRPYPSGGASYELEIYPVVDRCAGVPPGVYHYDAGRHALVPITGRTSDAERLIANASATTGHQATPQIVLVIAARFARVMWKYRSMGYGTILRNVGVLYQTLYLAATDLGLSPCALGGGDSALFARITGLDPVVEGSVGEFILGGRPRSDRTSAS